MLMEPYGAQAELDLSLYFMLQRSAVFLQREVAKITAEHGLTYSQFVVMETLRQKGLTVWQIMDRILATSGNLTVVLRNLEKMGYIRRDLNPADKRSYLISLTEEGKRKTAEIVPLRSARLEELLSVCRIRDKAQVNETLENFCAIQEGKI